jgi:hypothetical protein
VRRWWRRLVSVALSSALLLAGAPIASAAPAGARLRNPTGVGANCPDYDKVNLDRLPGRDGRTRLPDTNPPRSFEYDWPLESLSKLPPPGSALPGAPSPLELAVIGSDPYSPDLDYDPFTRQLDRAGRPRREVIARWNRAVARRNAAVAAGKTYPNGTKYEPFTLKDWPALVAQATKGSRNTPMGDAYEELVRSTLGLSGRLGWKCNESMEKQGGDKERFYDAVNHELRLIYEFKSTCTVKKDQLDKDVAFMRHQQSLPEQERYTIVYIFAEDCGKQTKAMAAAGILRYVIAAEAKVKAAAAGQGPAADASGGQGSGPSQKAPTEKEAAAAEEAAAAQQATEAQQDAAVRAAESTFTEPGQAPAAGALVQAVAGVPATAHEAEKAKQLLVSALAPGDVVDDWTADELGGVDFRTLELRYLADPTEGKTGLRYAFSVRANADGSPPWGGLRALQENSDSFFVWLALDSSRLWVNLHPDEPDRIIDPELGRTDAGRAMLEADLQMKKTVAKIIHPDSPTGAKFWDSLRGMDAGACLTFRQWIVPAPAVVREDDGGLYIVDAPLAVKLETEHQPARNVGRNTATCRSDKAVDEHNEKVFREMVLPKLVKAVNTAPEYEMLRRVYLTRVAAEWYKQRSLTKATALQDVIGSNSTAKWPARTNWKPRDVFDRFVRSYRDGEFTVERRTRQGDVITTTTFVYGGVDFSASPRTGMNAADFTAAHAGLPGTVAAARVSPIADDDLIWLGGESADRASGPPAGRTGSVRRIVVPLVATVSGLILIGVVVTMVMLVFRRPRQRSR